METGGLQGFFSINSVFTGETQLLLGKCLKGDSQKRGNVMGNAPEHVRKIGSLSEEGAESCGLSLFCYRPGVLACNASALLQALTAFLGAYLDQVQTSIESAERYRKCAEFEFNHQMKVAGKERWSGAIQGGASILGGICDITGSVLQLRCGGNDGGSYTAFGRAGASGFQGVGGIWSSQHRADQEEERGEVSISRSAQQVESSLMQRTQSMKEKWVQLFSEMLRIWVVTANVHSGGQ